MRRLLILLIMSSLLIGCPSRHHIVIYNETFLIPRPDYKWVVEQGISFSIDRVNYVIPAGFETDLASIPKALWSIVSPIDYDLIVPSIIHDYLYKNPMRFTRKEIDSIFFWSLVESGLYKSQAYIFYIAVRLFGGIYFNKDGIG